MPAAEAAKLRFRMGDRVECYIGKVWLAGAIVKVCHRESDWPTDREDVPYQVDLDDETTISVKSDTEDFIKAQALVHVLTLT